MSATWSARLPWFPAEGVDVSQYLEKRARRKELVKATVFEVQKTLFIVEVYAPVGRVYVTFRRIGWEALTSGERIKWMERDLNIAAAKLREQKEKAFEAFSRAMKEKASVVESSDSIEKP